jgi:L-2-hydroxyglutarate oxidase LhgO
LRKLLIIRLRGYFIIEESIVKRFINVAGINSPGLTASPSIARELNIAEDRITVRGDCGCKSPVKAEINLIRKLM